MGLRYGKLRVKEILRFIGGSFIFQAVKFGGDFFSAKYFGPEIWGEWYFIYTIVTYCVILSMGNISGSALLIPQLYGDGKTKEYQIISKFTVIFSVILSLVLVFLFFVFNVSSGTFYPYIFLVSAAFLLYTMTNSMVRSFGFFDHLSVALLIMSVLYLSLPLIAYSFHSLVVFSYAFFGIYIVGTIILSLKLNILNFNGIRNEIRDFRDNKSLIYDTFKVGLPIMIIGLSFLLYTSIDRLLIKHFFNAKELGYYSIAIMLLSGVLMIPKTISQMIYPRVSNSWGKYKNYKGVKYWIRKSKFYSIVSIIPITLILFFLAPIAIEVFLSKYLISINFIKVLLLSGPAYIIIAGYGNALNVLKRQKEYFYIIIASIAFNLIVSLLGYYYFNSSLAFAVGTTLAYYFYAFLLHFYTRKLLH